MSDEAQGRYRHRAAQWDSLLQQGRCVHHPDRAVVPGADRCAACVRDGRNALARAGPPVRWCPQHPARRVKSGQRACGVCLKAARTLDKEHV